MRLAGIGLAIGIIVALLTTRLLRGLFMGVTPTDILVRFACFWWGYLLALTTMWRTPTVTKEV